MTKRKRRNEPRVASPARETVDVAARVRKFREAAGMTQEMLARRAHLTAKFVSQIENGHANPSIDVVARIVQDGLLLPLSAFFSAAGNLDVRDDLTQLAALMGGQPPAVRRRALRVLRALCDE